MRFVEHIVYGIFPTLRILPRWKALWDAKEVQAILLGSRAVFVLAALTYSAHLLYLDSQMPLDRSKNWEWLRVACIVPALLCWAISYLNLFKRIFWSRLPMAVYGLWCTYLQGVSMNWSAEHHYMISIIVAIIATVPLRLSTPSSIVYLLMCFATEYPAWANRPEELSLILTMSSVALVLAGAFRMRLVSDVNSFINERRTQETQSKLIEAEMELNTQIRAFLPKEIFGRFEILRRENHLTALQAMDEVLRCREARVTCLHSDIRSFTKLSKDGGRFLTDSAIPNIRNSTDVVENHGGIPKLIGDLVFAYFDGAPAERDLLRALLCAFELKEQNSQLNKGLSLDATVRRFVLISHGNALVGNIGGSEGSRDITVMGSPANILSRIDPLTKSKALLSALGDIQIILTQAAAEAVKKQIENIDLEEINLKGLSLQMRDFPEEHFIYGVVDSESNHTKLIETLSRFDSSPDFQLGNGLKLFENNRQIGDKRWKTG